MANDSSVPNKLIAHTQQGDLEGTTEDGTRVWRGIPYTQPPVGESRGHSPRPPLSWMGLRTATEFGPIAVQQQVPPDLGGPVRGAEDCLYLNVWVPGTTTLIRRARSSCGFTAADS